MLHFGASAPPATRAGDAGFGAGNFDGAPKPDVKLHAPSRQWHSTKVLFEKARLNTKLQEPAIAAASRLDANLATH